jgi:hypothetical protein
VHTQIGALLTDPATDLPAHLRGALAGQAGALVSGGGAVA